jgi:hypothetical protein
MQGSESSIAANLDLSDKIDLSRLRVPALRYSDLQSSAARIATGSLDMPDDLRNWRLFMERPLAA